MVKLVELVSWASQPTIPFIDCPFDPAIHHRGESVPKLLSPGFSNPLLDLDFNSRPDLVCIEVQRCFFSGVMVFQLSDLLPTTLTLFDRAAGFEAFHLAS